MFEGVIALSSSAVKLIALGLLVILAPVAYLTVLDKTIPHAGLKFNAGWMDTSFQPEMWKLANNTPVDAHVSSEDGVLTIYASGNVPVGTIVAAQRWSGLDFNLTEYRYLNVSIKTSGLALAARIVVWTEADHGYVVLLKTYNNDAWHTEIMDVIHFLGDSAAASLQPVMIELSWQQVSTGSNSTASYSQFSFNSLEAA